MASRRRLDRLGAGTRSAPRDALIASSVDEKGRGRAFGLEGVGDNAGAFLGPIVTQNRHRRPIADSFVAPTGALGHHVRFRPRAAKVLASFLQTGHSVRAVLLHWSA